MYKKLRLVAIASKNYSGYSLRLVFTANKAEIVEESA